MALCVPTRKLAMPTTRCFQRGARISIAWQTVPFLSFISCSLCLLCLLTDDNTRQHYMQQLNQQKAIVLLAANAYSLKQH